MTKLPSNPNDLQTLITLLTAMKKEIDLFAAPLMHATPFYCNNSSLTQVFQSQNLIENCRPHKEAHPQWHFSFPYTPLKERKKPPM
jgi:hypothetical protein